MPTPKQDSDNPNSFIKFFTNKEIIFCTDDSAYGFVIGLSDKYIVKLNSNYKAPLGNPDEEKEIRKYAEKRLNLEKYDEMLYHAETLTSIATNDEEKKSAATILIDMNNSKELKKDTGFNTTTEIDYLKMAKKSVEEDSWNNADLKVQQDAHELDQGLSEMADVAQTLLNMGSIQEKGERLTALKERLISYKKNQNERDTQYEATTHLSYSDNPSIPTFINYGLFDNRVAADLLQEIEYLPEKCVGFRGLMQHLTLDKDPTKPTTQTGIIIMESVGDLTLDDVVNRKYTHEQYIYLKNNIPGGQHIPPEDNEENRGILSEYYKAKGRALLLTYMCLGLLHGDPHMENIRIDSTTGQFYLIDFGASIHFQRHHNIPGNTELEKKGHYTRHIPLYLKTDSNTMLEFETLDENINNWINFMTVRELGTGRSRSGAPFREVDDSSSGETTSLDNENFGSEKTFYEYYKTLKSEEAPAEEAPALPFHMLETDHALNLLKYTILKANPRQNGELLHWETINENGPDHYREGYKWIVENLPSNWQHLTHLMLVGTNVPQEDYTLLKEHVALPSGLTMRPTQRFSVIDRVGGRRTRRKKRKGRRKTHKKQKKRTIRRNKKVKRRRTRHK